jgi:hypothetical protein
MLFFRKRRLNYLEHLVFILYVTAHINLLTAPAALLVHIHIYLHQVVTLTFNFIFFAYAAVVFYQTPRLSGTIRALFASAMFIVLLIVLTIAFTIFYVKYFVDIGAVV